MISVGDNCERNAKDHYILYSLAITLDTGRTTPFLKHLYILQNINSFPTCDHFIADNLCKHSDLIGIKTV